MCVAPARECPHRESVEIHQGSATMLRVSVHARQRSAAVSKDTGAARGARTSARVRGPIIAKRRGGRGVLTPWARLPSGEGGPHPLSPFRNAERGNEGNER